MEKNLCPMDTLQNVNVAPAWQKYLLFRKNQDRVNLPGGMGRRVTAMFAYGGVPQRGYFHIRRSGGLVPKFASEILVEAPNFASKNVSDKYPKFCPLNFRYDPKIGTFPNFCVWWWQNFPNFSSYLVNLAGPCPKFWLQTWCEVQDPPTSLFGSSPPGGVRAMFLGLKFHLKAIFLGLKFAV